MAVVASYDFSGWASKNNLRCADGRVIKKDAFKVQDGMSVPLVWNHQHTDVDDVLGHAILENREDGVYVYGSFNDTAKGQNAKSCVKHGDVTSLSILANNLVQNGTDVEHGTIREVSLVIAGANPGARIESVAYHGLDMDFDEDEGILFTGENIVLAESGDDIISHADDKKNDDPKKEDEKGDKGSGETIREVYNTLNDKQKMAVSAIVTQVVSDSKSKKDDDDQNKNKEPDEDEKDDKKGGAEMKHNIFEGKNKAKDLLSHSDFKLIFEDAKRCGSLKESVKHHLYKDGVLAHALDLAGMELAEGKQTYGFNDAAMLFPEPKATTDKPEWISREMTWVQKVLSKVHRTPFSRIKSVYANITEDEARAKGYIKGNQKKEEVFTTLKRTTTPQTIYKLQKLDRDDILDITDFDSVSWVRSEMKIMLDEEKARAILIGDGRQSDSDDKISEEHIRPVVTDVPLFNTTVLVSVSANATESEIAKATINAIIKSRKRYKGSGSPDFYTTTDVTTDMLLLEDGIGHKLYKTDSELATTLRVKEIIEVEPMEGYEVTYKEKKYPLIGTIVNLIDYNVGADKNAGETMFDDFDIDFNQYKYLLETRMSGALIKPFSAITLLLDKGGAAAYSAGPSSSVAGVSADTSSSKKSS